MIHVGISGPIASGKSTLAKSIKQLAIESGYACEIIPFAAGVREVAALEEYSDIERRARITNLFYSWGYDYKVSLYAAQLTDNCMNVHPTTNGMKNRKLLQAIGTEVGRHAVAEDIWIHHVQRIMRGRVVDFVISDDVRFDNETLAVDVHIGIEVTDVTMYVERVEKLPAEYTNDHISEKSLTIQPMFYIPIGFNQKDVLSLFEKLDYIRRLRY